MVMNYANIGIIIYSIILVILVGMADNAKSYAMICRQ